MINNAEGREREQEICDVTHGGGRRLSRDPTVPMGRRERLRTDAYEKFRGIIFVLYLSKSKKFVLLNQ